MVERIIIGNSYTYNGTQCVVVRRKKGILTNSECLVIMINGREEFVRVYEFRLKATKYTSTAKLQATRM